MACAIHERQVSSSEEFPVWEVDGRSFWNALAKQAEANLAMSKAILSQSQRMVSNECVAALEPDRLESWYVADRDAANVAKFAGDIAEQTNSLSFVQQAVGLRQNELQSVDATRELGNAGRISASPEKAEALHAGVAKPIVGTKRRVPSVLELLTAQGADALVAEGDMSLTDGKAAECSAEQATGKGQASDISEKDPERIRVAKNITNEAMIHRCAMDGECVRGVQGGQSASDEDPETLGSSSTETFEARASELPRPPEPGSSNKTSLEGRRDEPGHLAERFDREADEFEVCFFDDFRKGVIQEEVLRDALDYFRAGRTRPSKIREIDIVEARLEIARSLRKAKGGAGETTKKAKHNRSRQKGRG